MNIGVIIKVSLRALGKNKVRTFLTALGIIIGVGAVISMISIGQGAKISIEERFNAMGTNLLFVTSGSRRMGGVQTGSGGFNNLKEEDATAIATRCDAVKDVSSSVSIRTQVVYSNKNWNTSIQGTGAFYPEIRNWVIEEGVFFDENMVKTVQKVCVLGQETKKNLFEGEDSLGKIIRIKKIPFRVIGVLRAKGQAGGFFNQDDMIVAPYTTVQKRLMGIDYLSSIDVSAVSALRSGEAKSQIEELLRIKHKIVPGAADDFQVRDMSELAASAEQSTQIMTILLGSIAAISLLVGGIGIMNIMLVSVTERTREIGIRMAVGARQKDILSQFLTEAVILSVLGGAIGVFLGFGISKALKYISIFSQFRTVVSPVSIVLAFCFATAIGIFFGFYPAHKASKFDPIEALRYE